MDYEYIINELDSISLSGTMLQSNGYDPAWNVAIMLHAIQNLIRAIQNEANSKQESK